MVASGARAPYPGGVTSVADHRGSSARRARTALGAQPRGALVRVGTTSRKGTKVRWGAGGAAVATIVVLSGCSGGGDAGDGHGAESQRSMLDDVPVPDAPAAGAYVRLVGFHDGTLELTTVDAAKVDPDAGTVELKFTSEDDGKLYIRGEVADDLTLIDPTVAVDVPLHVSEPNKLARRYIAGDGECTVTLAAPPEPGQPVAGSIRCEHVLGPARSELNGIGNFDTG